MSSPAQYTVLDDRNFQYQSNLWGFLDNLPDAYDATLSFTTEVANATINFSGLRGFVFGAFGQSMVHGRPSANFYLDGKFVSNGTAPLVSVDTYNQLYYDTGNLSTGDHQIVVENTVHGPTLFLDYLRFIPPSTTTTSSSLTAVMVTTMPSQLATGSSVASSTTSSLPTVVMVTTMPSQLATGSSGASSKGAPVGVIVGGIVGGIALLGMIAFAAFLVIRRRRHDDAVPYFYKSVTPKDLLESELLGSRPPPSGAIVSPFPPSEQSQVGSSSKSNNRSSLAFDIGFQRPAYGYPSTASIVTSSGVMPSPLELSDSGRSGPSGGPLISMREAMVAPQAAERISTRQETDSGIRFSEAGSSHLPPIEDVPPEYSER